MRNTVAFLFLLLLTAAISGSVRSQEPVLIDAAKKGEEISPYIYGQFIEHLGRCIYGGIWAEMLEDRKFHEPVGSPGSPWRAWKCVKEGDSGTMKSFLPIMDKEDPFVGRHTPKIVLDESMNYACLGQSGLAFEKGRKYVGYVWIKCSGQIDQLLLMGAPRVSEDGIFHHIGVFDPISIPFKTGEYYKYSFEFEWSNDPSEIPEANKRRDATFFLIAQGGSGSVHLGTMSIMPADNVRGMRADTLALLKELDSPVYRWPGGNFVSGYDWNDGIGDRDRRPPRKNPAWQGIEHNDFGLDEFMLFCRELGTEPYIAVNTGNGDLENAVAQLEYANGSSDTPQGKRRAGNGHAEPYAVKFWGIGNEMYGDWQIGHMPTGDYAKKHNRFAEAFRRKDSSIELVAVGNIGPWDEIIMRQCADQMDYISEHFYIGDPGQRSVIEHVENVPNAIKRIAEAHRKYRNDFPELKGKNIRIAMDEWNYWYGPHVFGELGTRYFIRDGLGIAAGLHEYFRNSDLYYMANYAQTVNVIGCIKTSPRNAQFETTGLVLKLYRQHFGARPLEVKSPKPLDIAAALTRDGKFLTLGIVNPTEKDSPIAFSFKNIEPGAVVQRYEIAGKTPMDFNDPDRPQEIDIVASEPKTGLENGVSVPPYSVTILKIAVEP